MLAFHSMMESFNLCGFHPLLVAGTAAIVVLISWRIWKFTLVPNIWPNDPKVLPYWVPFVGKHSRTNEVLSNFWHSKMSLTTDELGHTWSFVRNPETLINNGL